MESVYRSVVATFLLAYISCNSLIGLLLHVIALSLDNTSVNMGKHNSIQSRALSKNSSIYILGCPCHILHNAAHKAATAFQEVSTVSIVDMHCCSSQLVHISADLCNLC